MELATREAARLTPSGIRAGRPSGERHMRWDISWRKHGVENGETLPVRAFAGGAAPEAFRMPGAEVRIRESAAVRMLFAILMSMIIQARIFDHFGGR